jgi:phosphoribosylamine--glycine ligase
MSSKFESDSRLEKLTAGSNKNIYSIKGSDAIAFEFSDRVSVFDWGPLNTKFEGRGEAMERFASAMARALESEGVPSAYLAQLSAEHGCFCSQKVKHPQMNSSEEVSGFNFVPLEIIVRWGVPLGSSLLKNAKYKVWERFDGARVDFTTKLEAIDRPVTREEAQSLIEPMGCSLDELESFVLNASEKMRGILEGRGLEIWDAKFELAFDPAKKTFILVDAITPDEMRLTLKGMRRVSLSKELLRFWMRQTPWFDSIEEAKKESPTSKDWKENVSLPEPVLGEWRTGKFVSLFQALADLMEDASSKSLWSWIRCENSSLSTSARVAVIGGGGREEALRWRMQQEGLEVLKVETLQEVLELSPEVVDSVLVSMDGDLADGVVDRLSEKGFWTFGPSKAASEVEWSKTFGRSIANKADIPSPMFSKQLEGFSRKERPPVLKQDGLAAGKGVFVCDTWEALEAEVDAVKSRGEEYYFEEQLTGEEASLFFECFKGADGNSAARFMGSSKDFKRRFLGDEGPNTGGMGALAPHPNLKSKDLAEFQSWVDRFLNVMVSEGRPYKGVLYVGAMRDPKKGWNLIEFNSRFGDPETQALCCSWPAEQKVLSSMLQLNVEYFEQYFEEYFSEEEEVDLEKEKVLCLSLVHPDYPGKAEAISLEDWDFENSIETQVYRTQSHTGRLAYVVSKGKSYLDAGDAVFETLLQSPWKDDVEWRMDILK